MRREERIISLEKNYLKMSEDSKQLSKSKLMAKTPNAMKAKKLPRIK